MKKRLKSLLSQIKLPFYILRLAYKSSKAYVLTTILIATISSAQPIATIWLTQKMIDMLMEKAGMGKLSILVILIVLLNLIFNFLREYFKNKQIIYTESFKDEFKCIVGEKIMSMQYSYLEDTKVIELKEQALRPVIDYGILNTMLTDVIPSTLNGIFMFVATTAIVSTSFPIMLLPIAMITLLSVLAMNRTAAIKNDTYKIVIPLERKIGCYLAMASDYSIGKDVRIYSMEKLIMSKIKHLNREDLGVMTRQYHRISKNNAISALLSQVLIFLIYGYIAYQAIFNSMSIADFTFYTGIFTSFSIALLAVTGKISEFVYMGKFFSSYKQFEALPVQAETNEKVVLKDAPSIEFKNVSFAYPNTEKKLFENISFSIKAGERIAIVGQNGAGKSTIVKLLCGLYEPLEGEILFNGKKSSSETRNSISAVFQDYQLLAFTIYDNVVMGKEKVTDISNSLKQADVYDVVSALPDKEQTYLYKLFEEKGIELSGGQGQKLAIARALYKNSPVILLDEPTAALDAVAEQEIFEKFSEISNGKTTVMISHRLSSTRFCDRIFVLDDGKLVEIGNHAELMMIDNGLYKSMFETQAKYYQKS